MKLDSLFKKAMVSKLGLTQLNFVLNRGIPFNGPHRFKIVKLGPSEAKVFVPFIRKNKNHIKGMHACCLATAAEYTSGLVLLNALDTSQYRLIMKSLNMEYFYQAKMNVHSHYQLSQKELDENIIKVIQEKGSVTYTCSVDIKDTEQNHICTGKIEWQIKNWNQVKTKL